VGGKAAPLRGNEVVAGGSDGQLIIVDPERRRSYEMWKVSRDADGTVKINRDGSVTAASMSVTDLDGRGVKTAQGKNLNITGAGVSRLFGVIRANEVKAASHSPRSAIRHALQVSLPDEMICSGGFRRPATKTDGRSRSTGCVEAGARVQIHRSYDCGTTLRKLRRAICFAMQRYGGYVMDSNGSNVMAFFGQHTRSWRAGAKDYRKAGITGDYYDLGLPMRRMRVLATWSGE